MVHHGKQWHLQIDRGLRWESGHLVLCYLIIYHRVNKPRPLRFFETVYLGKNRTLYWPGMPESQKDPEEMTPRFSL